MTTETQERPTLHIDIFSRPVMKEAERMLAIATPKDNYEEERLKRQHTFNMNESAHAIESALVALGVYPDTKAAERGCFHFDEEANKLEIHGDNHDIVINTLSINEYPTLVALFEDIKQKTEALKKEAATAQAEFTAVHTEAWNMIYTDLVTMGVFPSVEEAKKHNFTLKGSRFLNYYQKSHPLKQMFSDIIADL